MKTVSIIKSSKLFVQVKRLKESKERKDTVIQRYRSINDAMTTNEFSLRLELTKLIKVR